jgi:hypothetical protein
MTDEKEYTTYFDDVAKQENKVEVNPEIAAVAPEVAQQEVLPEQVQPSLQVTDVKESEKRNIAALRIAREKAERERDELAQKLQEMLLRQQTISTKSEESSLNPDDLVEWKYVSKEIKQLRDEIRSYQQASTDSAIENRLKAQYPDFDKIVTKENIEILRAEYPELAETIATSPNLYSKGSSAYTLIKKLGIAIEDPLQVQQDAERIKINNTKPRSTASISPQRGESPLSKANAFAQGLTDDLKKQLYKEMQESMKNK